MTVQLLSSGGFRTLTKSLVHGAARVLTASPASSLHVNQAVKCTTTSRPCHLTSVTFQHTLSSLLHTSTRRYTASPESNMPSDTASTSQVAVVGAGTVGSTVCYSLILNPAAHEVLVVDPQEKVRDAQVGDLSDATYHGNTTTTIRAAEPKEAGQADIIVITAGAAQKEGESRTDLIGRNLKILSSVIDGMKPIKESAIILVVANPVDVLTHFALQFSGLPKSQVIGSGTFLDSARLRGILAAKAGIAGSSIDAYVLGEHGDSQVVAWSTAAIGGVPLAEVVSKGEIDQEAIAKETKEKAARIMENKGATAYGIGGVAASICKSLLYDQRNVRPVSHFLEEYNCCLSMPAVLGRKGIVRTLKMPLSEEEKKAVDESAKSLQEVIKEAEEKHK